MTVKVPATTANLGPGFDSLGLALSFGITVDVFPSPDGSWRVEPLGDALRGLPIDESNLIVRAARQVAGEHGAALPPVLLRVRSEIPLARGLGSSASAIVAGAALADELGGLGLGRAGLAAAATRIEGHPDNVAAAVYGGLTIAAWSENPADQPAGVQPAGGSGLCLVRAHLPPADIVVCIPDYRVRTADARAVLPEAVPHGVAALAGARGNVLVAALLAGDWEIAGRVMEQDLLHEPYRLALVPDLDPIREVARRSGAYGAALSGSGPTVVAFFAKGRGPQAAEAFRQAFPRFEVRVTAEDKRGTVVRRSPRTLRLGGPGAGVR